MKKQWISAALVLLLMLLIPVTVSADVIYPAPEDFTVGKEVDHLLATLDPGGTVWTDPELLPEGLRLETVESEGGVNVYLRGVPTTPGTYDLVISYSGHDSLCTVNILPAAKPVGILVETLPHKIQYTAGDLLEPEGLSLRVEMSDGSSQVVSEGFELYPTRLEKAGIQQIEVSYEGQLCYFTVDVDPGEEVIEGIGVVTLPAKVAYELGETLEPAGLSIRVYTNNGTRDVEAEELECSPMTLETAGQQTITVRYEGHECTFTVTVLEEEAPAGIAVYRLPERLEYNVGDTLDTRGLILIVTSNRDSVEYLDAGYTCEPTVLETPGAQEITVRFGDLVCVYHVTVKSSPVSPTPEPSVQPSNAPEVTPEPTAIVITPSSRPTAERFSQAEPQSGKTLVAVIVIAALLALVVLGVYVVLMNRGGKEYFAESIKELFRRRR